jgi:hypothetical protein
VPQALIPVITKVVGSKLVATIIGYAITVAATSFLSSLLSGSGRAQSESTERDLRQPTPQRLYGMGRRRWYGAQMLFDTASNGTTGDVWAFLDCPAGPITEVEKVYLNDDAVTLVGDLVQGMADGRYSGPRVRCGWNIGLDTETAFSNIVTLFPTVWSADHRGDGIFSGYLTKDPVLAKDFLKVYPQGDNVTMSLVAKSYRCHDPRDPASDPSDPSTWPWTENAALHLLWYYMVYRGYDYATRLEPVIDYWIEAANVCDEPVALAGGGTESRYRGCVAWDALKLPADIISELLACFDGWTGEDAHGCQLVYAGKLYEPAFTIGPDQILAASRQFGVEAEDRLNQLVVHYVSEANDWNVVECSAWRDEVHIAASGREVSDGFAPQVPSFSQNRRLAKRRMLRQNAPVRGRITVGIGARDVLTHRYILLNDVEAGATFYSGWAEVSDGERDHDTGGATFSWIAVDPTMDDWNPAAEEGSPAPDGTRVPVTPLDTPVITSAVVTPGSGGTPTITLLVTGPDRTDLTWFAHWRVAGASTWGGDLEFPDTDPGTGVTLVTDLVPTGESIEVQVAYQVGDGRVSPWSATEEIDTTGPIQAELILVDKGGCTVSGRTAIKTSGGATAWDSAVRSAAPITGTCRMSFRPAQSNKDVIGGLNSDAATSGADYSGIDYSINADATGNLVIYQSGGGGIGTVGTYAAGDVLAVEYDSTAGEIRYYKGATLLHTTTGVSSGLTFYLDASFYHVDSRIDAFAFDPE